MLNDRRAAIKTGFGSKWRLEGHARFFLGGSLPSEIEGHNHRGQRAHQGKNLIKPLLVPDVVSNVEIEGSENEDDYVVAIIEAQP